MQHHINKPLNIVWLKAAIIGSIWASLEIILGSFLHNLRMPLTGTTLSFIGVYLLTAFTNIWTEKGIIWRAGLICALMKSISPSAVIMGPMIGIFSEALLIELFVTLLGRNLAAYVIGGGLAVFSTLVQMVVNLLILYGFDFVRILASLYKFALKQINLPEIDPYVLIALISGLYIFAGFTAAVMGYFTAKKYSRTKTVFTFTGKTGVIAEGRLFNWKGEQQYSLMFLFFNVAAVVLCLFLINLNFSASSVFIVSAYVVFCFYYYKNSVKHLKRLSFWLWFVFITLAAGYFLNGITKGNFFTYEGLLTGFKMNLRAVIIIVGFAAIGAELRNPLIKSVLCKKGFSNVYQSLSLAFSALPGIIESLPMPNEIIKKPFYSFAALVNKAEALLDAFQKDSLNKPVIFIITGEIGEGKTTYANSLIDILKQKQIDVAGFTAPAVYQNGKRAGFDLHDVRHGEDTPLCRNNGADEWLRIGNYFFPPDGLKIGNALLQTETVKGSRIVIIDEIGPLEMNNTGWAKPVENLCRNASAPQIWVVRKKLVERVIKKWNVGDVYVFDIAEDNVEKTAEFICGYLEK